MTEIVISDPTLDAADRALEKRENSRAGRTYLGMSMIGGCERKSYYHFYHAGSEAFNAGTLKNFADGHRTEDLVVERLRMVDGLTVIANDPLTNRQIEVVDFEGHFAGHLDGEILGLKQAPATWHVLEVKCVGEKNFAKFKKIKQKLGEKATLREWNETYYAQHQLYMLYTGRTRGYTVVASSGGRDWDAVRTDFDQEQAEFYARRGQRIVQNPDMLPARLSEDPKFWQCGWCSYHAVCHAGQPVERNCRTCIYSAPIENAAWVCKRHEKNLSISEQRAGCADQRYRPALIAGQVVSVDDDAVTYALADGDQWVDRGAV